MSDINLYDCKKSLVNYNLVHDSLVTSTLEDGIINLRRLKDYIDNDISIKATVLPKVKNSTFDYKSSNFIDKSSGKYELNVPKNEDDHIKALYDLLSDIISDKKTTQDLCKDFNKASSDYNCKKLINDLFEPLCEDIDYELQFKLEELKES